MITLSVGSTLTSLVVEVHQIPFVWELAMSTKLDAQSNVIGSYETKDLSTFMYPEEKKKGKRRLKMRRLDYELVWNITEMQIKTFVKAIFPNPTGPLTMQLAKERPLGHHDLDYGESRSQALVKDIQVSAMEQEPFNAPAALPRPPIENARNIEQTVDEDERLDDILGPSGRRLVNDLASEYRQPPAEATHVSYHVQTTRPMAPMMNGGRVPEAMLGREPLGIPGSSRLALQGSSGGSDTTTTVSCV
jgi:hypothetical protein